MKTTLILALAFALSLATAPVFAQSNPGWSTTLSAAITADQTTISLTAVTATGAMSGGQALGTGSGLMVDGEYMTVAPTYKSGLQVPVLRGRLGTVAKAHQNTAVVIVGPRNMFSTANPGALGSLCPSPPAPWLLQVNVTTGDVWLCRQLSPTRRVWTATNELLLTYNSLTVR